MVERREIPQTPETPFEQISRLALHVHDLDSDVFKGNKGIYPIKLNEKELGLYGPQQLEVMHSNNQFPLRLDYPGASEVDAFSTHKIAIGYIAESSGEAGFSEKYKPVYYVDEIGVIRAGHEFGSDPDERLPQDEIDKTIADNFALTSAMTGQELRDVIGLMKNVRAGSEVSLDFDNDLNPVEDLEPTEEEKREFLDLVESMAVDSDLATTLHLDRNFSEYQLNLFTQISGVSGASEVEVEYIHPTDANGFQLHKRWTVKAGVDGVDYVEFQTRSLLSAILMHNIDQEDVAPHAEMMLDYVDLQIERFKAEREREGIISATPNEIKRCLTILSRARAELSIR